jgi:hypothetical protein
MRQTEYIKKVRIPKVKRKQIIWTIWISVIAVLLIAGIYSATEEKRAFRAAQKANNIEMYELFLSEYPDSEYEAEVYESLYKVSQGNGTALLKFYKAHPYTQQSYAALKEGTTLYYEEAVDKNTIEGWDNFMALMKELSEYEEELYQKTMEELDTSITCTLEMTIIDEYAQKGKEQKTECIFTTQDEENVWTYVMSEKTIPYCKKYIEYFPQGKHKKECDKLLVDLEIEEIFSSGEYGELPPMEKANIQANALNNGYSIIEIYNRTPYNLTLLYGGEVESKRFLFPPEKKRDIRLRNGYYRIAASVDKFNVRDYAGEETLDGSVYNVTYYIDYGYSHNSFNPKNMDDLFK